MFDKIKVAFNPIKAFVALVVSAIVLIWFWHPIWHFVAEIATKADAIFK